ncbi:hypothetical protein GGX14DRAFT_394256 [Mycena pura]|uniref:Uncharacterized protein n=1 Tax=Mycena pura TaxID=153505 RepID=A0AAD6VJH0_9AGAR|nr:hypothetical protein GGX14DRAFT_394256 [Mycena pura]
MEVPVILTDDEEILPAQDPSALEYVVIFEIASDRVREPSDAIAHAAKKAGAPSEAAKNSNLILVQRDDATRIYNGRPMAAAPPAAVYHPAFGDFARQEAPPDEAAYTPLDLQFATLIVHVLNGLYLKENLRQIDLCNALENFLGKGAATSRELVTTAGNCRPDGCVLADLALRSCILRALRQAAGPTERFASSLLKIVRESSVQASTQKAGIEGLQLSPRCLVPLRSKLLQALSDRAGKHEGAREVASALQESLLGERDLLRDPVKVRISDDGPLLTIRENTMCLAKVEGLPLRTFTAAIAGILENDVAKPQPLASSIYSGCRAVVAFTGIQHLFSLAFGSRWALKSPVPTTTSVTFTTGKLPRMAFGTTIMAPPGSVLKERLRSHRQKDLEDAAPKVHFRPQSPWARRGLKPGHCAETPTLTPLVERIQACMESGDHVFTIALSGSNLVDLDASDQHLWVSALETPSDGQHETMLRLGEVFMARCPNCLQTAHDLVPKGAGIIDVSLHMKRGSGSTLLIRLQPRIATNEKRKRGPSRWNLFVKKMLPQWKVAAMWAQSAENPNRDRTKKTKELNEVEEKVDAEDANCGRKATARNIQFRRQAIDPRKKNKRQRHQELEERNGSNQREPERKQFRPKPGPHPYIQSRPARQSALGETDLVRAEFVCELEVASRRSITTYHAIVTLIRGRRLTMDSTTLSDDPMQEMLSTQHFPGHVRFADLPSRPAPLQTTGNCEAKLTIPSTITLNLPPCTTRAMCSTLLVASHVKLSGATKHSSQLVLVLDLTTTQCATSGGMQIGDWFRSCDHRMGIQVARAQQRLGPDATACFSQWWHCSILQLGHTVVSAYGMCRVPSAL